MAFSNIFQVTVGISIFFGHSSTCATLDEHRMVSSNSNESFTRGNCREHEVTEMVNNTAKCICQHGYIRDLNDDSALCKKSKCIYDDECGINEKCKLHDNVYECRCISGYERDSAFFHICQKSKCLYDDECGTNEKCELHDNVSECKCISGYERDSTFFHICRKSKCVYDDECGTNEKCQLHDNVSECKCISGYERDSSFFHICRKRCFHFYHCPSGTFCQGRYCIPCDHEIC